MVTKFNIVPARYLKLFLERVSDLILIFVQFMWNHVICKKCYMLEQLCGNIFEWFLDFETLYNGL